MKKFSVILFCPFYLFVSAGILVNAHYCHGRLASVKIYASTDNCICSALHHPESCCQDESYLLQIDNEHQASQSITIPQQLCLAGITGNGLFSEEQVTNSKIILFISDISPPEKQPAWLLYCSLTYYG